MWAYASVGTGCNEQGSGSEQGEPNFCVDVEGCIKERQAESLVLGLEHIQPFSFMIL
jgi:hypothetical protein